MLKTVYLAGSFPWTQTISMHFQVVFLLFQRPGWNCSCVWNPKRFSGPDKRLFQRSSTRTNISVCDFGNIVRSHRIKCIRRPGRTEKHLLPGHRFSKEMGLCFWLLLPTAVHLAVCPSYLQSFRAGVTYLGNSCTTASWWQLLFTCHCSNDESAFVKSFDDNEAKRREWELLWC